MASEESITLDVVDGVEGALEEVIEEVMTEQVKQQLWECVVAALRRAVQWAWNAFRPGVSEYKSPPFLRCELIMGDRFTRQRPFLKTVLAEANRQRRNQLLRLANSDQINAISELALNTVRGVVPRSRDTVRLLRPYQDALKQLMQRKRSVKSRRKLLMDQSGGALWSELNRCFKRCCNGRHG